MRTLRNYLMSLLALIWLTSSEFHGCAISSSSEEPSDVGVHTLTHTHTLIPGAESLDSFKGIYYINKLATEDCLENELHLFKTHTHTHKTLSCKQCNLLC